MLVVKRMDVNAFVLSRVTGRWTGRVVEVCDAIRTVKSFSAEPHVLAHVNELTTERQLLFRRSRVYFIAVVGAATPTMNFARYSLLLTAAYVARSSDLTTMTRASVIAFNHVFMYWPFPS